MDITVVSTGRTFRRIEDGVGFLLMEAFPESFRRTDPRQQQTAAVPMEPGFFVSTSPYTGAVLLNYRRASGEVIGYNSGDNRKLAANTLGVDEIPDPVWSWYLQKTKAVGFMPGQQQR